MQYFMSHLACSILYSICVYYILNILYPIYNNKVITLLVYKTRTLRVSASKLANSDNKKTKE